MSYILDALKKAERDRLREDPKELDDFASSNWDPYQQAPKSNSSKTIIALACMIVVLAGLVIYSGLLNPVATPQILSEQEFIKSAVGERAAVDEAVSERAVSQKAFEPAQQNNQMEPTQKLLPLPELQISGHMYMAEGSPSNRLFANDGSFRQGEKIDANWTLDAIGINGIEVSAGELREFLPYR